jgi:hypothetical protein
LLDVSLIAHYAREYAEIRGVTGCWLRRIALFASRSLTQISAGKLSLSMLSNLDRLCRFEVD